VPRGIDTWRIRYVTQDRGRRVEATAAVIVPRELSGDLPVLLWEHFTSGATDLCAPSALGAVGLGLPMAFAARTGMVVVAPDYLGMNGIGEPAGFLHPYVIGEPTAIASLDAVRAAADLADREGLAARLDLARAAVWGASQGGHAALWVDRFAGAYLPELRLRAVLSVVPPSDVVALVDHGLSEWSDTSETLVSVSVTTADWYGLDPTDLLLPEVLADVEVALAETCDVLDPAGDRDSLESVYTPEALGAVGAWDTALPDWGCALGANTVHQSPLPPSDAPLLMVLAELDTLAWSPPARADAERACEEGRAVSLIECAGLDHEDAALETLLDQEAWLLARMAGEPLGDDCDLPAPRACGEP
jgi:hypothetical protein